MDSEESVFVWVGNPRSMIMFVEIANPCIALGHFEVIKHPKNVLEASMIFGMYMQL